MTIFAESFVVFLW